MQVPQTFSREIVIRCPACRFRLKDIHEMSPIVWVWYRLRNSFCLWFQPSIVRTPRTEIGSLLFAGMHHDRFDLSEVSCTREFQFVTSWFTPLSIKMSRIEKEQFIRRLTHFTRTGASLILSATWLHTYTRPFSPSASFRIHYITEVTFSWFPLLKDLQISYTFRTLELHHPQEHPEQQRLSVQLHLKCPLSPLERWSQWTMEWRMFSGGYWRVGKRRRPRGWQRSAGDEAVTLN